MTSKEKAEDLVAKMNFSHPEHEIFVAKQCALICVYEIIQNLDSIEYYENGKVDGIFDQKYWHQVKEEINKITTHPTGYGK